MNKMARKQNFNPNEPKNSVPESELKAWAHSMYIRAGQILGGFLLQTPSLSLTQTVTPYQFLGPYDIVLPRHESFEVGHFKANIEIKWPSSKLLWRGKTMP